MVTQIVVWTFYVVFMIFTVIMCWYELKNNKKKVIEEKLYEASKREVEITTIVREKLFVPDIYEKKLHLLCNEGHFILPKENLLIFNEIKENKSIISISYTRDCRDEEILWGKLIKKIKIER